MAPPTLLEMATRIAIQHRASITDFADMSYDLTKPILNRIEDPEQLHEIELNCPQIAQNDKEIWTTFLDRSMGPQWRRFAAEKDVHITRIDYDLYRQLHELQKREIADAEQRLRDQMQALDDKKKINRTQVSSKLLPAPNEIALARKNYTLFTDVPRPSTDSAAFSYDFEEIQDFHPGSKAVRNKRNSSAASNKRSKLDSARVFDLGKIQKKYNDAGLARRRALERAKLTQTERLRQSKAQLKEAPRDMIANSLPQASRLQYMSTHSSASQLSRRPLPQKSSQSNRVSIIPPRVSQRPMRTEQRTPRSNTDVTGKTSAGAGHVAQSASPPKNGSSVLSRAFSPPGPASSSSIALHPATPRAATPSVAAAQSPASPAAASSPAPRPAARRRPAPSIFMQPKRRKI